MARAYGWKAQLLFAFEVPAATGTSAAYSTNVGNGTCTGSPATGANAKIGRYYLVCTAEAENAGTFEVIDPDGVDLGDATVAVEFSTGGHLTFTIADGSEDFDVGDGFYVDVGGYATAPSTGAYYKLPFISADLSGEQPLEEDDTIGLGRDPQDPTYDILRCGGQIVVPLDLNNIGFWLKLALDCSSAGVGAPYTHTFSSGAISLPSATIEIGHPQVPSYFLYTGCRINTLQLGIGRSGKSQVTMQVVAQNETESGSSVDATPNELTLTRFHKFQGKVQLADADLGNQLSADLTLNNNFDSVDSIRADELVAAINPGKFQLSGNLTGRFAATTLFDAAAAQAAVDLDYLYTITSVTEELTLACTASFLPKSKRSVAGPGGVESTYAWQGSGSGGTALTAVLYNAVASYVNAS